jgi:hypothetical protein
MATSERPDGVPTLKDYLLAGVVPPPNNVSVSGVAHVGTISDVVDFLSDESVSGTGARSLAVLGEHGELIGLVSARSDMFLVSPPTKRPFGHRMNSAVRDERGFLAFDRPSPKSESLALFENTRPVSGTSGFRPVTCDLSVATAGLNRSYFEENDALFISAGLQIELMMAFGTDARSTGPTTSFVQPGWRDSIAVALDSTVLSIFREIVPRLSTPVISGSELDRTD